MVAAPNDDVARMASFIPRTVGPWLSEADQVFDAETIFDYIDGAGEVYRSYNMAVLVARRFHKDGRPDLVVDLFDMGSSRDAFGVFTHDLDGEDVGLGQGSTYKGGLLSFWKDRYFVSVYAEEETPESKAAVLELGRRIAEAVPGRGERPELVQALPAAGLETKRVRFFHNHSVLNIHYFVASENILGLGPETDVVLGSYPGPGGRAIVVVAAYPDPGLAEAAKASFIKAYMPEGEAMGAARTENGRFTAIRAWGRFVSVVFDEPTEGAVKERLDAVEASLKATGLWREPVRRAGGTTKGGKE